MNKRTFMCAVYILMLIAFSLNVAIAAPQEAKPLPAPPKIEYFTGEVLEVSSLPTKANKRAGIEQADMISARLTSGPDKDKTVTAVNYTMGRPGFDISPQKGDKIILAFTHDMGREEYHVADYERMPFAYVLAGVFILSLLVVGRRVGLRSLFVVTFAVFAILEILIPLILKYNWGIIPITFIISAAIALVTQFTVSGWNPKTWGAALGTIGGVAVAAILATAAISFMHLTGLESEEAIMLKISVLSAVNFQDVLFAGIILGSLGAVMDVAISIASAQYEIARSCPDQKFFDLFKSGMNVGRDVMGTMANTLILAYLGSSLPLVLLFSAQKNVPLLVIMNFNLVATEMARALTGSTGLVLSIPLTAAFTAFFMTHKFKARSRKTVQDN